MNNLHNLLASVNKFPVHPHSFFEGLEVAGTVASVGFFLYAFASWRLLRRMRGGL